MPTFIHVPSPASKSGFIVYNTKKNMSRIADSLTVLVCLLRLTAFFSCGQDRLSTNQPTSLTLILLICLDDMGYGALSLTGAIGYHTPNIDRMAQEGLMY